MQALRVAILSGRYKPGQHIAETDLATQLGISRGTIREALRHLQQEGLLTVVSRGRLQVWQPSPTEIHELYQVRAGLEGLAVTSLVTSERHKVAARKLQGALARLDRVTDDFVAQVEADLGFHLLLCELSGNSILVRTWRHLEGAIRITVMSAGDEQRRLPMSAARHQPIVDAIESGDEARALDVLREHMNLAARQLAHPVAGPAIDSGSSAPAGDASRHVLPVHRAVAAGSTFPRP